MSSGFSETAIGEFGALIARFDFLRLRYIRSRMPTTAIVATGIATPIPILPPVESDEAEVGDCVGEDGGTREGDVEEDV